MYFSQKEIAKFMPGVNNARPAYEWHVLLVFFCIHLLAFFRAHYQFVWKLTVAMKIISFCNIATYALAQTRTHRHMQRWYMLTHTHMKESFSRWQEHRNLGGGWGEVRWGRMCAHGSPREVIWDWCVHMCIRMEAVAAGGNFSNSSC